MRNESGFAVVESLATTAFAFVAISAGCTFAYYAFAHQWLKHAAYETSICLSTPAPRYECESRLRRSTQTALPIGKLENISLSRSRTNVTSKLRWSLNSDVKLAIDDVRSVPLLGRSAP